MSKQYRAAIIGCGPGGEGRGGIHSISYAHGWAYAHSGRIELVAAASRAEQNRNTFIAEFPGVTPCADYSEMLCAEKPDIVSVCGYPPEREEMVVAALETGAKIVWAEKPFTISIGAGERMLALAQAKGARIFVNHQRRFGRVTEWFRDAVRERKIGDLLSLDVVQPGPKLLEFGPHLVDAALFALGDRKPVCVIGAADFSEGGIHQGLPFEHQLVASVRFEDGVRLTVEAGKQSPKAPALRAQGTSGFAELNVGAPPCRGLIGGEIVTPELGEHFHHGRNEPNLFYHRAIDDILRAYETGEPSRIDASEAMRGAQILLGIYESARLGRMIPLPMEQQESPLLVS